MKSLPKLSLPPINAEIRRDADGVVRIYDELRQRFVALTPEEWVRQHFASFLINICQYPRGLMANEVGIRLNNTIKRCDTVVYDKSRRPIAIVEYKAPNITLSQNTFDQIVRYNMVLQVPLVIVSNGLVHYCCAIDYAHHVVRFLDHIPSWTELTEFGQ